MGSLRILITGAGGTLGTYICRELLSAGHAVTGYSRNRGVVEGVRWISGDAQDCDELARNAAGHDAIIHLAAIPGPGRASPEVLLASNIGTTACALEAAVRASVPLVVIASSGAALGFTFQRRIKSPQYFPVDEMHPCEPQDPYGLSKRLGELTCESYTEAFGLRTVCLRVNNAWYVDRDGAELAVRSGWARGLTVEQLWESRYAKIVEDSSDDWPSPGPVSPRNNLWAVIDARDVARAFRISVERPITSHEIFNLNGNDTCSCTPTTELLAKHFPEVPIVKQINGFETLISNDKMRILLGFRPEYSWRQSDFSEWLQLRSAHGEGQLRLNEVRSANLPH
jgi:nucleoside-diphosphate-sugar epimerase